jgi:hypothetical protein
MGKIPVDDVKADAIEREIDTLRQRTQDLIVELEDRVGRVKNRVVHVKELARDVPSQLRSHAKTVAGVGTGTLAMIGVGVWLLLRKRNQERRFSNRMLRRARGYRALIADPQRALAAREPALGQKLMAALVITAAATVVRKLIERGLAA